MTLTICDELTRGLQSLASKHINVFVSNTGQVDVALGEHTSSAARSSVSLMPNIYMTGDLAFDGMVLGKEGMSGHHCHLCKLSGREMTDLTKEGEPWGYDDMIELANTFIASKKKSKKPANSVKNLPWFTSIPLQNYVVPLLHCLIGIGNDLLAKFRGVISEQIEYIKPEEIQVRQTKASMLTKV